MDAGTESVNDRSASLKARADELTARMKHAYGPKKVLLSYERGVLLYQYRWSFESERLEWQYAQLEAEKSPPPIYNRFWDVDTLIVSTSSRAFKTWLLETLDRMVTDYSEDWLVGAAQPGNTVLIERRVADKRTLEVSPEVWVIDVDVEGLVIWCDPGACDPDKDVGDIIMITKQVLDSTLSFKIIPTDNSSAEVRRFCGTRELAQQFYEARKS